jgi:hypothetical protein
MVKDVSYSLLAVWFSLIHFFPISQFKAFKDVLRIEKFAILAGFFNGYMTLHAYFRQFVGTLATPQGDSGRMDRRIG